MAVVNQVRYYKIKALIKSHYNVLLRNVDVTFTSDYGYVEFYYNDETFTRSVVVPTDNNGIAEFTLGVIVTGGNVVGGSSSLPSVNITATAGGNVVEVINLGEAVTSVQLASSSNILFAYDNESATLTATVTKQNGNAAVGKTVSFYKDNVLLGTATTNSSGVATKSYSAIGDGALTFKAVCEGVDSNTVTIEDYYLYDPLTTDKSRYTLTDGGGTLSYNSDGLKVQGSQNTDTYWYSPTAYLPSGDYTVEVTYVDYGTGWISDFGIENMFIGMDTTEGIAVYVNGSSQTYINRTQIAKGSILKFEVTGTTTKTIKIYNNSALLYTATGVNQTRKQFFKTHRYRWTKFKDLKIYQKNNTVR